MKTEIVISVKVKEINDLHELSQGYAKSAIENAIRIGELLTEIKASLNHGEWLPWVEGNLPFGINEAGNYMRIYRRQGELNSQPVVNLKEAVNILSTPKPKKTEPIKIEAELLPVEDDGYTGSVPEDDNNGGCDEPDEYSDEPEVETQGQSKGQIALNGAGIFKKWDGVLKDLHTEILNSIANNNAASHIFRPFYNQAMKRLRETLKSAMPAAICQGCDGMGCTQCERTGFKTFSQVKGI